MQKLCCVRTRQHPLPVWSHKFVLSSPTHISANSRPFLVGIVSLEGYILIPLKALYGLKSSGKRWAEVIHDILRDMKFLPSRADPCIWLRKAPNLKCYEYIAVYVDDLYIAAESPSAIIQIFKSKYHLKVKGDGKLTYHLGADYFEDPDGTYVSQPKKYIDKLADTY